MPVCNDAVCLKGGKAPWVDQDANNGSNEDIIIKDCQYGYFYSALTCGSESVHNRNIIYRYNTIDKAVILPHFKMPGTPQKYEYILVENIKENATSFIIIAPWSQFYVLKKRKDIPLSYAENITMRNIHLKCKTV